MARDTTSSGVGTAFAIVCCAGLSTGIGASVVFIPRLVRLANHKVLAASLGGSAGVMLYLSFVEMFSAAGKHFIAAGHGERAAFFYTTMSFFSGVLLVSILNTMVSALTHGDSRHRDRRPLKGKYSHEVSACSEEGDDQSDSMQSVQHEGDHVAVCPCTGSASDLNKLFTMVEELEEFDKVHPDREWAGNNLRGFQSADENQTRSRLLSSRDDPDGIEEGSLGYPDSSFASRAQTRPRRLSSSDDPDGVEEGSLSHYDNASDYSESSNAKGLDRNEQRRLLLTAMNTFLAISIHNFPEGLSTFIASLDNPGIGSVLAVAIIIHNIPEGICVALPIYYATGNRFRAFCWGLVSGLSEIFAALLAWAVLAPIVDDTVFGVMYSMVAGIMVFTSITELLPPALRYDPENSVTSTSFVVGMAVMALSLVLLTT